ncbi:MAG: hypothetical protein GX237_10910 [Clostridiales bacterium]|nr:hypothetical protein [Clostridiales bacterium]
MNRLNPDMLVTEFRDDVTKTKPILGRKYTLTHSDITGELFLTIGMEYASDQFNILRDEVIAEWRKSNGALYLQVYIYIGGRSDEGRTVIREEIFRRELPLALEAIRYGDRFLFFVHSYLDDASIRICFDMAKEDCQLEDWGYMRDYR